MKRILVPTDFSPTAEKAFLFAIDIAAKSNGTVILYHVYTPVESTFIDSDEKRKQYNRQTERDLVTSMERLRKKVKTPGIEVPVSVVVGRTPVVNNILGFARENHIDMVVMGTQGASGLKKSIIGSVASRVIENSVIPVLLIPEKFEWKEPEQLVFVTDYGQADRKVLSLVLSMAKLYNARVTIVHLISSYLAEMDKTIAQQEFDSYASGLQKEFAGNELKFQLLKTSSIPQTMENLHDKIPYDIITMVKRKKTFLEKFFLKSFTRNMTYLTTRPLLVVPEEE